MFAHLRHHRRADRILAFAHHRLNLVRAEVTCHDDDCVLKVHRAALAVGHTAVIQHLKQDVENVRVRFFNFIQKNDAVGLAAHRFGQIAPFFVANVSRRRTDQTSDRVLFHKFTHVDTNHGVFRIKEEFSQSLRQLRLTDTGRA